MRLSGYTLCSATLILLGITALAPGATIQQIMNQDFDPTTEWWGDYGISATQYSLTFDDANIIDDGSGKVYLDANGRPNPQVNGNYNTGPNDLSFVWNQGGGGGGQGGGGTADDAITYTLKNKKGGTWKMDFAILIFDPGFAGTEIKVEIYGAGTGAENYLSATLAAAKVQHGVLLQWSINAGENEDVFLKITGEGGETYPAGFFYQNDEFKDATVPEPATLGLLALGLAGFVMRRRGR